MLYNFCLYRSETGASLDGCNSKQHTATLKNSFYSVNLCLNIVYFSLCFISYCFDFGQQVFHENNAHMILICIANALLLKLCNVAISPMLSIVHYAIVLGNYLSRKGEVFVQCRLIVRYCSATRQCGWMF